MKSYINEWNVLHNVIGKKLPKVEMVGDCENLKKMQFLVYFFSIFVVFCCLQIMNFGMLFFMVWHHSMLICVVFCVMFGQCALWKGEQSYIKEGASNVVGEGSLSLLLLSCCFGVVE